MKLECNFPTGLKKKPRNNIKKTLRENRPNDICYSNFRTESTYIEKKTKNKNASLLRYRVIGERGKPLELDISLSKPSVCAGVIPLAVVVSLSNINPNCDVTVR